MQKEDQRWWKKKNIAARKRAVIAALDQASDCGEDEWSIAA